MSIRRQMKKLRKEEKQILSKMVKLSPEELGRLKEIEKELAQLSNKDAK